MKGIYVLAISVDQPVSVSVGAQGCKSFQKGLYAYVGSAQNNLEKRVSRHYNKKKRKFWHIDYLLDAQHVKIIGALFKETVKLDECKIAKALCRVCVPVKGFGSSDCSCEAHLFQVKKRNYLNEFAANTGLKPFNKMTLTMKSGWCIWVTGLPGSGKSTVSTALLRLLKKHDVNAQLLSSDALRKVLTPDATYSIQERDTVYSTLVYIAELLTKNNVNVIIDATGNLNRYRDNARKRIPCFMEVYLKCPIDVCMQREARRVGTHHAPKHIYERAGTGKAPTVPGVGQPYEQTENPELTLDATKHSSMELARKILDEILIQDNRAKKPI